MYVLLEWWLLFLGFLLVFLCYSIWSPPEINCIKNPNRTYTHIIGAGTTGCVLAARLSENQSNKVLLIEAGGQFNIFSKIPLFATFLQKSVYDWSYKTEAQKWSSVGFLQKQQSLPRGKGLGGTGQMNFMIYDVNIENIVNMWDSVGAYNIRDNILAFFDTLAISRIKHNERKCQYHMYLFFDNKIKNSPRKCTSKPDYSMHLQKANSYLGYVLQKAVTELKNSNIKYQQCLGTIYQGQRWSTYDSHLRPASRRHNLHVLCYMEVIKIIFKDTQATGIYAVDENNTKYRIFSSSEIILCSGAINTPKLLLRSGIGNVTELNQLNITSVINVPGVGLNLHDHFYMPLYVSIKEPVSVTYSKILSIQEIYRYLFDGKGMLARLPLDGVVHALNSTLLLFSMGSTDANVFCSIANYLPMTFKAIFPFYNNYSQEGLVFLAGCMQPTSRGFVKLNHTQPMSSPLIDPQYLHDERDIACIKNGIKLAHAVINTKIFAELGATIHWPKFNACKNYETDITNEDYLGCIIHTAGMTAYHQAGTCKIGRHDDPYAVVDYEFRVKGIAGLRVVDASILPTPASTFPTALLIAVAEYAAELL